MRCTRFVFLADFGASPRPLADFWSLAVARSVRCRLFLCFFPSLPHLFFPSLPHLFLHPKNQGASANRADHRRGYHEAVQAARARWHSYRWQDRCQRADGRRHHPADGMAYEPLMLLLAPSHLVCSSVYLQFAAMGGSLEIVKLLLHHGARVNIVTAQGATALMLSLTQRPNMQVLETLIEAGVEVNAQSKDGMPRAHVARCGMPRSRYVVNLCRPHRLPHHGSYRAISRYRNHCARHLELARAHRRCPLPLEARREPHAPGSPAAQRRCG